MYLLQRLGHNANNFQEEVASLNLQKFKQIQQNLEQAEERAEVAENTVVKFRIKVRPDASMSSAAQ